MANPSKKATWSGYTLQSFPKGQSKKPHHPWTGPLRVVGRLSDSDYRVKALRGQKRVQVVHFDRLKLCVPGTRFPGDPEESPDQASNLWIRSPPAHLAKVWNF